MNETSALVILIAAIFTNNILLTKFLGMCSFIACSGQIRTSLGLGTAVTFVMTMTTMINYAIYHYVLVGADSDSSPGWSLEVSSCTGHSEGAPSTGPSVGGIASVV